MTEPEIDILVEDPAWQGLEPLAATACTAALSGAGLDPGDYAISILACDDDRIAALNADFRGKPAPTNVLSWPAEAIDLPEGGTPEPPAPGEIGDIAIARGVCEREAAEQGKPLEAHITHLLVHATLHLLGYDHETDADAAVMEGLETAILARLGLPDPY
ncbi:rRNA maturation RNase YbeY [Rhodobacterales bacterium HKCCE2091]|nr:rRNA maturation RNase YbeY [Rhodobacterales bacterium HKCCE2091]